jgi:hypothetical protein
MKRRFSRPPAPPHPENGPHSERSWSPRVSINRSSCSQEDDRMRAGSVKALSLGGPGQGSPLHGQNEGHWSQKVPASPLLTCSAARAHLPAPVHPRPPSRSSSSRGARPFHSAAAHCTSALESASRGVQQQMSRSFSRLQSMNQLVKAGSASTLNADEQGGETPVMRTRVRPARWLQVPTAQPRCSGAVLTCCERRGPAGTPPHPLT